MKLEKIITFFRKPSGSGDPSNFLSSNNLTHDYFFKTMLNFPLKELQAFLGAIDDLFCFLKFNRLCCTGCPLHDWSVFEQYGECPITCRRISRRNPNFELCLDGKVPFDISYQVIYLYTWEGKPQNGYCTTSDYISRISSSQLRLQEVC